MTNEQNKNEQNKQEDPDKQKLAPKPQATGEQPARPAQAPAQAK